MKAAGMAWPALLTAVFTAIFLGCQGPPQELAGSPWMDAGRTVDKDAASIDAATDRPMRGGAASMDAGADHAGRKDAGTRDAAADRVATTDAGTDRAASADAGARDATADRAASADAGGSAADGGARPSGADYTVVILPDTQFYASTYPAIFDAQTSWIAEQRTEENIAFVVHEGDLVDSDDDAQWMVAAGSMSRLDGLVPYVVSMGNHDYGPAGDGWTMSRSTTIDSYFPVSKFAEFPWFKGVFDPLHIENNYALLDTPDGPWLVISLEFGPRDAVLAWADGIAKANPTTPIMVVTHAYLYNDNLRYDHVGRPYQRWNPHSYPIAMADGAVNDGEEIWQKLIQGNGNIRFVFSGHVLGSGTGRLTSQRPDGTSVNQILANYQMLNLGGSGYLRLLRFSPTTRSVHVQTYSPYLDLFQTDSENDFTLPY